MRKLPKLLNLGITIFALFVISASIFAGKTYAQTAAVPPPGNIPCTDNPSDPEFASDRPYQASRCGGYHRYYWCGNSVVLDVGSVETTWDPSHCTDTSCQTNFDKLFGNFAVDLTNVQLPILGNTQNTLNSQNAADAYDSGTKVSNYVSWYLGGTNSRAEYQAIDTSTPQGVSEVVDTSGPIQKLLPGVYLDEARISSIDQATKDGTYTTDTDGEQGSSTQTVKEPSNHNQIVVCANHDGSGIWSTFQDLLGLGKYDPIQCYKGDNSKAQGDLVMRLKDWNATLTANIVINTIIQTAIDTLQKLYPFIPGGALETSIGDHWKYAKPPLPWDNGQGQAFKTEIEYEKAYYEWRGNLCAIIPVINKLVCFWNAFVPTKYADMFPYVPLANTVDKKGVHMVTAVIPSAAMAQVQLSKPVGYILKKSPQLYLAHSLENFQLSNLLKLTYEPATPGATTIGYPGATTLSDTEDNSTQCRIIPSASNPGDPATFSNPKSYIEIDQFSVHVSEIECTVTYQTVCDQWNANHTVCLSSHQVKIHTCKSDVYATVPSVAKYGYTDDIWNNTVAKSDSIFRRIYPKTGANSPVSCIADDPAVSDATYTMDPALTTDNGAKLIRVIEPDGSSKKSGDPKGSDSIDANLYFPHYGSVLDYFINGIQTALRPKGYGSGPVPNGQYCTNLQCGQLPNIPKASGSCVLGSTSSKVGTIPPSFKEILSGAAQQYGVPPNLILGVMYGEGAFNPGRYNWTDQNVKNWATCERLPNCSGPGSSVVPFIDTYWNNLAKEILPDLQKIDPAKKQADPCNLLDATYALAKDLSTGKYGGSFGIPACFGITLNTGASTANGCTWGDSDYESSIKVWENGYDPACLTKENSCFTGGGNDAICPTGGDTCETISNRYPDPSHNGCVWDVAHGN